MERTVNSEALSPEIRLRKIDIQQLALKTSEGVFGLLGIGSLLGAIDLAQNQNWDDSRKALAGAGVSLGISAVIGLYDFCRDIPYENSGQRKNANVTGIDDYDIWDTSYNEPHEVYQLYPESEVYLTGVNVNNTF